MGHENADAEQEMGEQLHGTKAPGWMQFYQLETRVRQLEVQLENINKRLEHGAERFTEVERKNEQHCNEIRQMRTQVEAHNTHVEEVKRLLEDIKSLLEVYDSARGTVAVLSALGGFLKWATGIGGAIALVWLWLKTGIKS